MIHFEESKWPGLQHQFQNLTEAVFDSSSIIYCLKTGILTFINTHIAVKTTELVQNETGTLPITPVVLKTTSLNTDDSVIEAAEKYTLPLVTEDKGIIKKAQQNKLNYYNTLIIIIVLYFRRLINKTNLTDYLNELRNISYYSNQVWDYGLSIVAIIEKERDKC
jgi:hypothetical protein